VPIRCAPLHPGCRQRSPVKPSLPAASPVVHHVAQQTQPRALSWRENGVRSWLAAGRSWGREGSGARSHRLVSDAQLDSCYGRCRPAAGCSPPQGSPRSAPASAGMGRWQPVLGRAQLCLLCPAERWFGWSCPMRSEPCSQPVSEDGLRKIAKMRHGKVRSGLFAGHWACTMCAASVRGF